MTRERAGQLVREFEPYHASRGGHVVNNLNAWGAERGMSEDDLDAMWIYLGAFVITDFACLDPHVDAYWHGPYTGPVIILDSI